MSRIEKREEIGGELVYSGVVFDIVHVPGENLSGPWEFALADDSVRVYPIDSDYNIWLAEEIRPGLGNRPYLRAISGKVEPGEPEVNAAVREAQEELGIIGGKAEIFHESTTSLKVLNLVTHVLLQGWTQGSPELESDEIIKPVVIPVAEIAEYVWSGRVPEDPVALALLAIARRFDAV